MPATLDPPPDRFTGSIPAPLVHYLLGGAPVPSPESSLETPTTLFVQGFLGHTSLATTGIYTQLTDPMLKEVVLRIPTALDLLTARQQGQEVRERWAAYQADEQYWEDFVSLVLEWPVSSSYLRPVS